MDRRFRFRVAFLVAGVLAAAGGIGARLYQLQVVQCDALRAKAVGQHRTVQEIPGRRGAILDRHGRELAVSVDTLSLYAHPQRLADDERGHVAREVAKRIGVSERAIARKLRSDRSFVWLSRRLDPAQVEALQASELSLDGSDALGLTLEAKRFYPRGKLGVHLIGYANIDQQGVEGIELVYDEALRSDPSRFVAVRDGRGRMKHEPVGLPVKRAEDVVLTVDVVLQHLAERELARVVGETRARSGSVVLLDPNNGELLALANLPNVDPNRYGKAAVESRRNRAVTDIYEPGSTFKIVTAAAALDRGAVHPGNLFDCEKGGTQIAGHFIRDHHPYGVLTFREVLEKSSNVGMIKVGRLLRKRTLHEYITRFGFGAKTGIELPGERDGAVLPLSRWSAVSPATIAFGQGVSVTPLQLAAAFGAVANDGVYVPPTVVKGRRDADGAFHRAAPKPTRRILRSETARTLTALLGGVVDRGTGRRARVDGYRLAGKTGTAQIPFEGGYHPDLHVSSFGGFGPVRAPRLVAIVVVHAPRVAKDDGGLVAAPAFARIMREALAHLRVVPDEPVRFASSGSGGSGGSGGSAAPDALDAPSVLRGPPERGRIPDLRGLSMRTAISTLAGLGYRARVRGSGTVVAQDPSPGVRLAEGETCTIRLRPRTGGTP